MIRGTLRLLPSPALRGLRINGFYDHDAYVKNADRTRGIFGLTYEHKYVNASWEYLTASDQNASATKPKVDADGYSFWIIPRDKHGWEGLIRYDHHTPNTSSAFAPVATAGDAHLFRIGERPRHSCWTSIRRTSTTSHRSRPSLDTRFTGWRTSGTENHGQRTSHGRTRNNTVMDRHTR
jgi:hypothetical protein